MTCATPWHLRVYRESGVAARRVRQRAGRARRAPLRRGRADARPGASSSTAWPTRSRASRAMQRELAAAGAPRPIDVLVEVGHEGGRCGCRTVDEAVAVAEAITRRAAAATWPASRRSRACARPPISMPRSHGVDAFMAQLLEVFERIAAAAAGEAGADGRRQRVLRPRRGRVRGPAGHRRAAQRLLRDAGRRPLRPRLAARHAPAAARSATRWRSGARCCRDPSRRSR